MPILSKYLENLQYETLPEEVLERLQIIIHIPGSRELPSIPILHHMVRGIPSIDILFDPKTETYYERIWEKVEDNNGPYSWIFGYNELTPQEDPRLKGRYKEEHIEEKKFQRMLMEIRKS